MKKRVLALLLVACMVVLMLVGCAGGSQATFLSDLLATDEINLLDFKDTDFENYCESKEVHYEGGNFEEYYTVTDSFLGYDAKYYFKLNTLTADEWEGCTYELNSFTIDIQFDSEKDLDEGLEKIKSHLKSSVRANYGGGNVYYVAYKTDSSGNDTSVFFDIKIGEKSISLIGEIYKGSLLVD